MIALLLGLVTVISCKKTETDLTPSSASISGFTCGSATFSASAVSGTSYTATATVPYRGGNGASYATGSAIPSSGVTGLNATLISGNLANGDGSIVYNITGTPSGTGTANFALNFGGQTCTLSLPVTSPGSTTVSPAISGFTCGSATFSASAVSGTAYTATATVPYTGGNGGSYVAGSAIASSGVTGLNATLVPGKLANGDGSIVYNITGTPSAAGTANFALNFGGQACTLSLPVTSPGSTTVSPAISGITCGSATFSASAVSGASYTATATVPYTGGNGGSYVAGSAIASSGVTGLNATLVPGKLANGDGTIVYNITGTPSGTGTANFALNFGGQTCTLSLPVTSPGSTTVSPAVSGLTCGSATFSASAVSGTAYTATATVPYIGGNGGSYVAGSAIASSGVTGLNATLVSGNLTKGDGTIVYNITGTPSAAGTASFALNFGGQTCTLSLPVK
ncbi:beta strand repeat-containing protein [Spirosoma aerolatum]|uniref:beta strand repeat-containing protein n=1 Tax=Spirosoma aerolatum TaxID=1211326 RepID=UPI0012D2F75D|nr:hypothetical protein [Spirosoma aerolatum]